MKGKIARRQFVESLGLGTAAFAGALKAGGGEAAGPSLGQLAGALVGEEQADEKALAQSLRPFVETFPLRFREKPVLKGKATIYGQTAFAFAAIPSVTRSPDGRLFTSWCASIGFARGGRIVGAYSSDGGKTWDAPIELVNNPDKDDSNSVLIVGGQSLIVIVESLRVPDRFDKFNPWPIKYDRTWWYLTRTDDGGRTWSQPALVQRPYRFAGIRGGNGYPLKGETLALPYYYVPSIESGNIPKLEGGLTSAAGMLHSHDGGMTWRSGETVGLPGSPDGADEPVTVLLSNGEIFCLLRNSYDRLYEMRSSDGGMTWSKPKPSPLPAYNAPGWLHRLEDRPGDELVVAWDYLPPWEGSIQRGRHPLVVAHSPDGGRNWSRPKMLSDPNPMEGFRADYPTICQTKDGLIVVVWQQETLPHHLGKELRVARFNRAWLVS